MCAQSFDTFHLMAEIKNQISSIWEEVKTTIHLNIEYAKLTGAEKLTLLISMAAVSAIIFVLGSLILFFISLATVWLIAEGTGLVWAYVIMASFYILMLVLLMAFRKKLIIDPVALYISKLIFNK